jgi:23S rRNA (uracil1939-C5)-methyltransferase
VGKLADVEVRPTLAPGPEFGYRNRMDYRLRDGRPALYGFESHDLVELSTCLLLPPTLLELFNDLPLGPRSESVTLRAGLRTGETLVLFDDDHGVIHEEVAGHRFQITDRAFFQTNTTGADELVKLVNDFLAPMPSDRLLDGYAGGGLFSVTVGAKCAEVIAVESDPVAIVDLDANTDATIVEERFERSRSKLPSRWDIAVVDPPRAGLGAAGIATLAAGSPRAIAYVSCDPASFARDAALLVAEGYQLEWAQPVDMFPQTFHIEIVGAFAFPA